MGNGAGGFRAAARRLLRLGHIAVDVDFVSSNGGSVYRHDGGLAAALWLVAATRIRTRVAFCFLLTGDKGDDKVITKKRSRLMNCLQHSSR